jgi:hypothetical protein
MGNHLLCQSRRTHLLVIVLLALAACTPVTPSKVETIQVQLASPTEQHIITREALLQIVPGTSTLQDVYALVGHPSASRDFPNSIALRYASEVAKLPHVIVVDNATGMVLVVATYNHNNDFFSLAALEQQYGQSAVTNTINSRNHLFFAGQGVAAIVSHTDHNDIWYVQRLNSSQSAEDYRAHEGYWRETFAFTP